MTNDWQGFIVTQPFLHLTLQFLGSPYIQSDFNHLVLLIYCKLKNLISNHLPKKGFNGVDRTAETKACKNNIAEWGTENGWAKAWNADPHVICHGAM